MCLRAVGEGLFLRRRYIEEAECFPGPVGRLGWSRVGEEERGRKGKPRAFGGEGPVLCYLQAGERCIKGTLPFGNK